MVMTHHAYSGKFSREKTFTNFAIFFRHPRTFYPRNSRHATPIMRPINFNIPRKFSPRSAPFLENFVIILYAVWMGGAGGFGMGCQ